MVVSPEAAKSVIRSPQSAIPIACDRHRIPVLASEHKPHEVRIDFRRRLLRRHMPCPDYLVQLYPREQLPIKWNLVIGQQVILAPPDRDRGHGNRTEPPVLRGV